MPNQRATGQTLIGCHLDAEFVTAIDTARAQRTRSQFLREALYTYLRETCHMEIPSHLMYAPDRAGKGGRPRKKPDAILNDKPATDDVPETREAGNYPVKKRTNRKKKL